MFKILLPKGHVSIPIVLFPKNNKNHGNYIVGLGHVCEWLGERAEELGVEILPGVPGNEIIYNNDGSVGGIITGDMGIAKDGSRKETF